MSGLAFLMGPGHRHVNHECKLVKTPLEELCQLNKTGEQVTCHLESEKEEWEDAMPKVGCSQ